MAAATASSPTLCFGRFELDEAKRELRLGAQPQALQPRVFDLLAYLVRNRERVVSKDELLTALWPDVIVTDSSIMRAVSILRTLLREGDVPDAIHTASRQGYRFTATLENGAKPIAPEIARARAAYEKNAWPQALKLFQTAHKTAGLTAEDFEHWARLALRLGQPNLAVPPLELAVAAYTEQGDRTGAARVALTLANVHLEGAALAVAKGWHRRAGALLAKETENREHGFYTWMTARIALFDGDLPRALAQATSAETIARRVEDADVLALGLLYRGQVELATGKIREGLQQLDEAGAAALSGAICPWVSGLIFCGVIWAYLDRGDIGRAGQWSEQFTRWSKSKHSFGMPGLCHLHRSEIFCILGDLKQAESEVRKARPMLAESAKYAEGDAYRVLGEIRFLQGDLAATEEAFREAHGRGWHPMPGWALLQEAKGDAAAAIAALQRALKYPTWADGQRRGILLAHLAQVAARAGRAPQARRALKELASSRALLGTAGCQAAYQQARAEVALMDDEPEVASEALREAITVWLGTGSQINAAHARLRLAEALARTGDACAAELEVASAEKAFGRMSAPRMVERCRGLRARRVAGK